MKRKRPHTVCSINLRRVPTRLRSEFKAWCAEHNYPMEAAIHELMRRAIANSPKLAIRTRKPPGDPNA